MTVIESRSVCLSVQRQQLARPAVNDYFISSDRMQGGSQIMSLVVTRFSSAWKLSRRDAHWLLWQVSVVGAVTYRRRRIVNHIPRFCRWRTRNKWRKYLLRSLTTAEFYVSFAWIENGSIQDVSFISPSARQFYLTKTDVLCHIPLFLPAYRNDNGYRLCFGDTSGTGFEKCFR